MDDKILHEGKEYVRQNDKWIDSNYYVAPDSVQRELNYKYFSAIDLTGLNVDELVSVGDGYKNSSTPNLAVRCYKEALKRCNDQTVRYILPRLTSCLRKQGKAAEVVLTFKEMRKKWGNRMLSPAALTSVAAAYCDLGEYENAKKCCDMAYSMSNGSASGELKSVYGRIKKESKLFG